MSGSEVESSCTRLYSLVNQIHPSPIHPVVVENLQVRETACDMAPDIAVLWRT
jgi:hypothetical protein